MVLFKTWWIMACESIGERKTVDTSLSELLGTQCSVCYMHARCCSLRCMPVALSNISECNSYRWSYSDV